VHASRVKERACQKCERACMPAVWPVRVRRSNSIGAYYQLHAPQTKILEGENKTKSSFGDHAMSH